jgi:tetratricopeptide (TPR) repeat protein
MRKIASLSKPFSLFLVAFASISLIACNPIKKMQKRMDEVKIKVEGEVLEVHADSLNLYFNTFFPEKFVDKKAILKLEPIMVYGTDSVFMEPFFVAGEKVDVEVNKINPENVVPYKTGGKVPYMKKIPYQPEMKTAVLYILTSYKIDSEWDELDVCICDLKKDKLADGVLATSQSCKDTESNAIAGSTAPSVFDAKGVVYYENDKYVLRNGWTESKDFKIPFVLDPLKEVVTQDGAKFKELTMKSQASPDGIFKRNEFLAVKRTQVSFRFIKNYFKELGFESVYDSSFYQPKEISEDWDGLKELISNSDLKTKQDILKIINSNLPLDEKEDNIRKLVGDTWTFLAEEILPKLRKTEIILTAETDLMDIEEIERLYKEGKIDSLNHNQEILMLAEVQDDLDKKMEIYKFYIKRNPKDHIGYNNLACVHIEKGETDEALEILEEINEKYPEKQEIVNNLGVAFRHKGDYDTAMYLYQKAEELGMNESNNFGILYIKTGQYQQATEAFDKNQYDYNRALAYILNEDYQSALDVIDKIEEKSADDFYLRAIAGARMKDIDMMSTSLTRAVKLDSSIRQRAKEDLEFRNYWDKAEFENAIR